LWWVRNNVFEKPAASISIFLLEDVGKSCQWNICTCIRLQNVTSRNFNCKVCVQERHDCPISKSACVCSNVSSETMINRSPHCLWILSWRRTFSRVCPDCIYVMYISVFCKHLRFPAKWSTAIVCYAEWLVDISSAIPPGGVKFGWCAAHNVQANLHSTTVRAKT
jgi:hypothetical protein